jgi:PAS domain S-box-containing protein
MPTTNALRLERELSDKVLETIGSLVVVLDREGTILKVNRSCRQMIGHTADVAVGRAFWDVFVPPADAQGDRELFEGLVAMGGPNLDATHWRIRNGHDRQIAWSNATLTDETGSVTHVIATGIDITDLNHVEEALRQANKQAHAASHAKDRFLAVLSHELRTPLTPILIAINSMLEPDFNFRVVQPELEMIRRNVELEARLIDDLLDVAMIVRGGLRLVPEVLDMHELIHEAIHICGDDAKSARMSVATELTAQHHLIHADHARIMQVVWNLIRNAARFGKVGDNTLTIRTSNLHEPKAHAADHGFRARLVVEFSDMGMGVDTVALERIFEPFEQGDTALRGPVAGLGLGLAICRSAVEAHGGRLSAMSLGRGHGSTFRIELDTAIEPIARQLPVTTVPQARNGLRVLLVEDNQDTLRYLAAVLRKVGHEVVTADLVSTARSAAAVAATPFDLLLSDIELPDGFAYDLMRDLGVNGRMAGLAMSGYGSVEDVQQSLEAGFSEHLTKPFDTKRLMDAIHRITSITRSPTIRHLVEL